MTKTATLVLPGGMYDYLADSNIWNEDTDAGSVATVNALNNGKLRRYGKGFTVTIEVTKAVADVIGSYADTILSEAEYFEKAEIKAAQTTHERIGALVFTEKETEPTAEPETAPEPQPETVAVVTTSDSGSDETPAAVKLSTPSTNKGQQAPQKTSTMTGAKERPETKAAKNVEPGDWVTFGRLAYRVGDVGANDDGTVWLSIGYGYEHLRADQRVTMDYSH